MNLNAKYLVAGDCALVVEFSDTIKESINQKVMSLMDSIERADIHGIVEMTPSYRSLLVEYLPTEILYNELVEMIKQLEASLQNFENTKRLVAEIPVCYDFEFGPDLDFVATHNHLSKEMVVEIHTGRDYLIYMLGFTPGFPYLGGMDESIATPRLTTPRTQIHAGSVGIAGSQTGIYPVDSPGGWQIIGRTPVVLFNAKSESPALLKPGMFIRFVPITRERYEEISNDLSYEIVIKEVII